MAKDTVAPVIRQARRQWVAVARRQQKHLEEALKAKSELEKLEAIINIREPKPA